MKIYRSPYDSVPLPRCSIFSLVFALPDRHQYNRPAFIDGPTGHVVTRKMLYELSLSLAYGVTHFNPTEQSRRVLGGRQQPGLPLTEGDVALLFAPNCIAYPVAFYGLQAAGIVTTLANASYTPRELAHQLSDSKASVAVVHPTLLPVLLEAWKLLKVNAEAARRRTVVLDWSANPNAAKPDVTIGGWLSFSHLLTLGKLEREVSFDGPRASSTAMMCYSSGTTGLAKGVESTHFNITSLATINKAVLPWRPDDVAMSVLPMYHIFGAVLCTIYWAVYDVPVVVMNGFSPDTFCAAIARYRISQIAAVPPILLALAKHAAPTKHDISSLRNLTSGAAPLSEALVTTLHQRLTGLGCKELAICQGYGLTETSPTVLYLSPWDAQKKSAASSGVLLPNLEVRLVADGPGEVDAKEGEPGELWVRGPTVMKGYLGNPKATNEVMTRDGFFKTGDIAVRDADGYYSIVDRKKELIKYKGFQVPPADLEAVLITHEEVADAAVIGIYSAEQQTELPRAYIVPAAGLPSFKTPAAKASWEKTIATWLASKVAKHKQLRGGVVAIEIVPKSAAGKILRRELRERAKKETGYDPVTGAAIKAKL